ncbi:MAG TPA: amidase [Planctomycetales bacterium]|jgi:amidase|nr:amidase [Planctomycetales bacterium]
MPQENKLNRRHFLQAGLLTCAAAAITSAAEAPEKVKPFELDEKMISELQEGIKAGKYTARSLVEAYRARIEEIDKQGPAVNSVIELNPDALEIADALDKERKDKGPRGPLHGIPVLIKDNIDTADRMATTAGSLALVGAKPAKDAFVVERLRKAGAVLLGKTNLSEWGNIRSSPSVSGWSARGGLTRNPYALDRNTSGSSAGSAAAVAASLCAAAVGTETDGSIVSPSSVNGVVGLKPTVGLIGRSGIIPLSHTQDTSGPIGRTVRDVATMLSALAGVDPEDKATKECADKSFADYTRFLDADGLKGARIGVVRKLFGFSKAVDAVMEGSLHALERQGATLVEAEVATLGKFDNTEVTVFLYELKADLNAYLEKLGPSAPVHSLKEIIEFNRRNKKKEMPYFGQNLFIKAEAKGPLTSTEYLEALELNSRLSRKEGIDAVMDHHRLDALAAPTGGPAWITDLVHGGGGAGGSSSLAAVAGYPNITVPAGYVTGLPVGISFFGRAWSEPVLLRLAYAFEQATKVRQPPRFLPTVTSRE